MAIASPASSADQLPQLLGAAECQALRSSVEATMRPHPCERLSPVDQQISQKSEGEQELTNLIYGHPAQQM
ncbi:hypothetical protein D3C81_2273810 [compost metagenome]